MASLDLEKKSEKVSALLLDKGVTEAPTMRVAVAIDISLSMANHFSSGNVQKAFDQLMGVSVQFDDDGELDVFKFDTRCDYVGTSTPEEGDYNTFIKDKGIAPRGGTAYSPIVDAAVQHFFAPKKSGGFLGFGGKTEDASNEPVLLMIVTDGEPNRSDVPVTLAKMAEQVNRPIYFHLVGVGGSRSSFPTIAHLADELPNVGEVYLPSFNMTDEALYEQLICDELIEFVGKFSKATA